MAPLSPFPAARPSSRGSLVVVVNELVNTASTQTDTNTNGRMYKDKDKDKGKGKGRDKGRGKDKARTRIWVKPIRLQER